MYEGNYSIVYDYVNGYPYWKQQFGNKAIWFFQHSHGAKYWYIGFATSLGTNYADIAAEVLSSVFWPYQIVDYIEYYDGVSYKFASPSDVVIKDCKCLKMIFNC